MEGASSAAILEQSKEEILEVWENIVRDTIGAAHFETPGSIRDSIPAFLDDLVIALRKKLNTITPDLVKFAQKHGAERARASHYSIQDALTEYNILRKVIFSRLEKTGPLPPEERDIILEAIDFGLTHAGAEFTRMQISQLEDSNLKLQEERGILDAVLEQMPAAVWIAKYPMGEIYLCNELAKTFVNRPETTKHLHDYGSFVGFFPDGRKYETNDWPMVRSLSKGEFVKDEVIRIIKSNGDSAYIRVDSSPVRNVDGEIVSAVTVSSEITEIIQLQDQLRKNEETLKLAIESSQLGIWSLDLETNKVSWSEKNAELFGFKSSELFIDFQEAESRIHPDDVKKNREAFRNTLATDKPFFHEIRILLPEGGIRWLKGSGKLIRDNLGKPVRVIGTDRDITEQKTFEQKLKSVQEKFDLATITSRVGVWEYDLVSDTAWRSISHDYVHGYDHRLKEWNFEEALKHIHPDDKEKFISAYNRAVSTKEPWTVEYRIIWPDSSIHWVSVRGHVISNEFKETIRIIGTTHDITHRKETELALKESEERFRQLANSVPQLVWSADSSGKVDYYNNKVISYEGVVYVDGVWKWETLVHPDDEAKTLEAWVSAVTSGTDYKCEQRLKMKNGDYHWHLSRGTPIKDINGNITRWFGTATDIHELKIAEDSLKKALVDIKQITDIQPTLISYVNKDLTYKFANFTYKCWFHESCGEVAGKNVKEVIGPGAYAIIGPYLNKALEGFRQEFNSWIPYRDETRYIHGIYHPDVCPKGEVLGVFVSIEDKTKEQLTLESLRSSEQQFISLANSIPQLAWMSDPGGFIFWYNQRWYEYTGTTPEEMLGLGWKKVQHPDFVDKVSKKIHDKLSNGEIWEDTFPLRSSHGEWRWFLSRAMPLRDKNGNITRWFGTNTDITDQKKLTDSLHEEQILRDKFISTLTHDLRTPLTAAKMSAQLIRKRTEDEKIQNFAFKLVENLDRADKMIQDLLDAGKIRAGKVIIPEIQDIDLVEVISRALEDLATIHGDRFILKAPSVLYAKLSQNGIRRAVENLCINAVKYGAATEPVIVSITEEHDEVTLRVHNKGDPLNKSDFTKLFEHFQQGTASAIAGKPGWGIGLTIVKGIAEGHGGKVSVESDRNGTTFQIIVPKDASQYIQGHIDRNELQ